MNGAREKAGRQSKSRVAVATFKTRPSDGQPVGSKHFDMEEYQTRKKEARAADPEAYERQKREARRKQRAFWDRYLDEKAHRECDQALKGEMPHDDKERLRSIWHWVVMIDQGTRNDQIHLSQASRISNARNNRESAASALPRAELDSRIDTR
jgi:hypothetical protein